SSRRRHTRLQGDWSSDVCSSDLRHPAMEPSFQRGFNGGPIDRIDLDELEQSLPVVTPLDGATSMGMVEQGPQRHEFTLDGLELRSEERRVGKECRERCAPDQREE